MLWIAIWLGSAVACGAQSALPATAPTATTPMAPIAATPTPVRGRRAQVTLQNGLLQVRADNSSLNVILRDISVLTGMKITGGVADERVFGNYGPASPGTILTTLLDGTGVNILLQQGPDGSLASLTLTPRQPGGVTPPSPSSHQYDEEANATALTSAPAAASQAAPQPAPNTAAAPTGVSTPPSVPQPWNNVNGSSSNTSPTASTLPTTNSVPLDSVPTPSTTPPSTGIVDAPNPPPTGSTAPQPTTDTTSPNGVKTPEQIYQQLLDLQKRKAAATPGSTTTAPQP